MEIDKIKNATALRTHCKEEDIPQAAQGLCQKARDTDLLPHVMQFDQSEDYIATGEYQVVLFCS